MAARPPHAAGPCAPRSSCCRATHAHARSGLSRRSRPYRTSASAGVPGHNEAPRRMRSRGLLPTVGPTPGGPWGGTTRGCHRGRRMIVRRTGQPAHLSSLRTGHRVDEHRASGWSPVGPDSPCADTRSRWGCPRRGGSPFSDRAAFPTGTSRRVAPVRRPAAKGVRRLIVASAPAAQGVSATNLRAQGRAQPRPQRAVLGGCVVHTHVDNIGGQPPRH